MKYIDFMKAHPQLSNETAQERFKRVGALWRKFKQTGGYLQQHQSDVGGVSAGCINPYGYRL